MQRFCLRSNQNWCTFKQPASHKTSKLKPSSNSKPIQAEGGYLILFRMVDHATSRQDGESGRGPKTPPSIQLGVGAPKWSYRLVSTEPTWCSVGNFPGTGNDGICTTVAAAARSRSFMTFHSSENGCFCATGCGKLEHHRWDHLSRYICAAASEWIFALSRSELTGAGYSALNCNLRNWDEDVVIAYRRLLLLSLFDEMACKLIGRKWFEGIESIDGFISIKQRGFWRLEGFEQMDAESFPGMLLVWCSLRILNWLSHSDFKYCGKILLNCMFSNSVISPRIPPYVLSPIPSKALLRNHSESFLSYWFRNLSRNYCFF